jgi:hypothetical protein
MQLSVVACYFIQAFFTENALKLSCVILQCERVGYPGNQVEDCTKAVLCFQCIQ